MRGPSSSTESACFLPMEEIKWHCFPEPTMRKIRQTVSCFSLVFTTIALIAALPVPVSAQADEASEPPLTEAKIVQGLETGVASKRMTVLVEKRGVDFSLTPEIEQQLRGAGANDDLVGAIRNAKVKPAAALVLNANADCTVSVNGTSFDMKAGETHKVVAKVGDNTVYAERKGDPANTWRRVVQVELSEQRAVLIQLWTPANDPRTDTKMQDQTATVDQGASVLNPEIHDKKEKRKKEKVWTGPTIVITSDPSGAQLEINGAYVGVTPIRLALNCGRSCFQEPDFIFSKAPRNPVTMTVSKDGCVPRTMDLTRGPLEARNGFGGFEYNYYLFTSDRFEVSLACR